MVEIHLVRSYHPRQTLIVSHHRKIAMLRSTTLGLFVFGLFCVSSIQPVVGQDWNQFRGPRGDGISPAKNVPTEWSVDKNILWKVPLPQPCNGSPIVSKDVIFMAGAEDGDGRQRSLSAYSLANGNKLWTKTVDFGQKEPTHDTNPYCGTTPAADGKHVVVWHSSAGLFCYDYTGKELWSHNFGDFVHMWGYGTSPIIHDGMVYLHTGPGKERVALIAMRIEDGKVQWTKEEPFEGDGEKNPAGKYMGSWATPIVTNRDGKDIIVCAYATRVNAYDAKSGNLLFFCTGLRGERGDLAYSSPLIVGDICVSRGGYSGPSLAFRLGGKGDTTDTNRLWRNDKNAQSIGSGVVWNDHYFMISAGPGTIQCMNAKTGKEKWVGRGAGNHWASLVLADGNFYATAQNGTVIVFKPSLEKLEIVARNKIGEPSNSTPAFVNGALVFRTMKHLYCIGKPVQVAVK
jgi:outer membrane protein assembly factor BamB